MHRIILNIALIELHLILTLKNIKLQAKTETRFQNFCIWGKPVYGRKPAFSNPSFMIKSFPVKLSFLQNSPVLSNIQSRITPKASFKTIHFKSYTIDMSVRLLKRNTHAHETLAYTDHRRQTGLFGILRRGPAKGSVEFVSTGRF